MAIASSDAEGNPSVRMVLLKGYDERGFVFYSNYNSRKGKELSNGKAALCMYWEPFQRSVSPLAPHFCCSFALLLLLLLLLHAVWPSMSPLPLTLAAHAPAHTVSLFLQGAFDS